MTTDAPTFRSQCPKSLFTGGAEGPCPQWWNGYKFLLCYTGTLVIYNVIYVLLVGLVCDV